MPMVTAPRIYPSLDKFLRENRDGWTLTTLARELGISKQFLCMIRYRDREPDITLALKIMAIANVPLESLIQKAS